jgi:hypothetical protein
MDCKFNTFILVSLDYKYWRGKHSRGSGLEVNTQITKYIFMNYHQKTRQGHNIKAAHKSFDKEAKFKYLGMTINKLKLHSQK